MTTVKLQRTTEKLQRTL